MLERVEKARNELRINIQNYPLRCKSWYVRRSHFGLADGNKELDEMEKNGEIKMIQVKKTKRKLAEITNKGRKKIEEIINKYMVVLI